MEYTFTAENFEKEVLKSEIPVLVDFYAEWCGPCKMMAPVIAAFAEEFDGKIKIGKCDCDDNMSIAQKYHVLNIPNLQIFKDGQVVDTAVGFTEEDDLRQKLLAVLQ